MFSGGEAAIGGHVKQQGSAQRQFFEAAGQEDQQLANRGLIQQILVGIVSEVATVFHITLGTRHPVRRYPAGRRTSIVPMETVRHAQWIRCRLRRLSLQRLQHPEHVHGQFRELGLLTGGAHDQDLLQAKGHVRRPLAGRRRQRRQPRTGTTEHISRSSLTSPPAVGGARAFTEELRMWRTDEVTKVGLCVRELGFK